MSDQEQNTHTIKRSLQDISDTAQSAITIVGLPWAHLFEPVVTRLESFTPSNCPVEMVKGAINE